MLASIAQSVECSLGKAEVTGSIPVGSTIDSIVVPDEKQEINCKRLIFLLPLSTTRIYSIENIKNIQK